MFIISLLVAVLVSKFTTNVMGYLWSAL